MLFNSLQFLLFFVVVTTLYYLINFKWQWLFLLLASCYFYAFFIPAYLLVLFAVIIIDYTAGIYIEKAIGNKRKVVLSISIATNLGVLVIFKYYNFFIDNINQTLGLLHLHITPLPFWNIVLPIGLSFHTLQAMSYTLEVYKGNQKPERHFGIYALYVMFYPQLVAGPIERPQNMLPQFHEEKKLDYNNFVIGLSQMIRGFFKKVVVADLISGYVDNIYRHYFVHSGFTLVFTSWMFVIQIYCDFSGYTDIAIGAAKIMGFDLMTNFHLPLFSKTMSELWTRWHISLSSWLRDYIFYPIVIKKRDWGKWGLVYGIMITFFLSGLWHGASWNFIIYGLLLGVVICIEILLGIKAAYYNKSFFKKCLGVFITFNIFSLSEIFFRSNSLHQAFFIIKHIFTVDNFFNLRIMEIRIFASMLFAAAILFALEYFVFRKHSLQQLNTQRPKMLFIINVALLIMILLFGISNGRQFIYFQF